MPEVAPTPSPFEAKRVLSIDDSATVRAFLGKLLTRQGAQVEEAANGEAALALLNDNQPYDLILLDLLLPDTDGLEILREIRARTEETTVVMLTGAGGIKSAMAAVRQGADGYLEKQDLGSGDHVSFFYSLEQALRHRQGLVAQKQLQTIKTDFYSMITHDLRQPTGALLLSLNMLQEEAGELTADEQHELLNMAHVSAERLLQLINDYLDYAKIDAGYLKLNVSDADLRELVESSLYLVRLQAHAKDQKLITELPPGPIPARVDSERLRQVLNNLLTNAIKYTPKGGQITTHLSVENEQATLQVSDTGPGIAADQLPALFKKYHRVPGETSRKIQGTGLGLLIVKEIAEAHGGTVNAASAGIPGQGTTFTVTFPLRKD